MYKKLLKKPLKIWAVFLDIYAKNLASPSRESAQKPLKIWAVWAVFQQDLSGMSTLGGLSVFFWKNRSNRSNLA